MYSTTPKFGVSHFLKKFLKKLIIQLSKDVLNG